MARRRSLKDAAADQLVEKNLEAPKAPLAPMEMPAAEPVSVAPAEAKPVEESPIHQPPPAEMSMTPEVGKQACPSALWRAVLIAIGFAAGFFFGIGQGIGPANMAYLVIGVAGGFFLGRCLMPT